MIDPKTAKHQTPFRHAGRVSDIGPSGKRMRAVFAEAPTGPCISMNANISITVLRMMNERYVFILERQVSIRQHVLDVTKNVGRRCRIISRTLLPYEAIFFFFWTDFPRIPYFDFPK